jgi:hypothetical protein
LSELNFLVLCRHSMVGTLSVAATVHSAGERVNAGLTASKAGTRLEGYLD